MATDYPGAIDDYTGQIGGDEDTLDSPSHPEHHGNIADAMVAVQTELGTNPSGSAANVGARIGAVESGLSAHVADDDNPHDVTAQQVGAAPVGHTHDYAADPHGNEAHSAAFLTSVPDPGNVLGGTTQNADHVAIHPTATTTATGAYGGVAIGRNAAVSASGIAVGDGASATGNGVAVGVSTATGSASTAVGHQVSAAHNSATAIGRGASTGAHFEGILGGTGTQATNNWIVPGDFTVNGTKNFQVTNPADPDEDIRHGAYEGPVPGGTIYRYTVEVVGGAAAHELPDYFAALNIDAQVWCQADRHFGQAYGDIDGNTLTLHANADGRYHVLILATRNDPAVQDWYEMRERKPKGITWRGETQDIIETNDDGDIETVYRAPAERTQTLRTADHMHHRRIHVDGEVVVVSREEAGPRLSDRTLRERARTIRDERGSRSERLER